MWKILVGFIIFAAAALFLIFKAGDKVDMQGEAAGHNPTEVHSASASAEATTPAPVAAPAPASDATASSK
jgi:3-oxoacyl-ACP reductase-like protein